MQHFPRYVVNMVRISISVSSHKMDGTTVYDIKVWLHVCTAFKNAAVFEKLSWNTVFNQARNLIQQVCS